MEREEARARRTAKWLDSEAALDIQKQLVGIYDNSEHEHGGGRGRRGPRMPPRGAAAALWAKYGQSEEDARALLAAAEARAGPPKKRQKREGPPSRSQMIPSARCVVS